MALSLCLGGVPGPYMAEDRTGAWVAKTRSQVVLEDPGSTFYGGSYQCETVCNTADYMSSPTPRRYGYRDLDLAAVGREGYC